MLAKSIILVLVAVAVARTLESDPSLILNLEISNGLKIDITTTTVTVENESDWLEGPHVNFQGLSIPAGTHINQTEIVNLESETSYFTMTLEFADGTKDTFTANLRGVVGGDLDLQLTAEHSLMPAFANDDTLLIVVV